MKINRQTLVDALAPAALALLLFSIGPATAASWVTNSPLTVAREIHTTTLLPSGKVLVAGGFGSNGATNSAELYDPATGTWAATGLLNTQRGYHTATFLSNGKVLVAGGFGSTAAFSPARSFTIPPRGRGRRRGR